MMAYTYSSMLTRRSFLLVGILISVSIVVGVLIALSPGFTPSLLALLTLLIATVPFVAGKVKAAVEPIVLVCIMFGTYAVGALDVVFFRGMRILHNRDTVDAALLPDEAAFYLSFALVLVISGLTAFYFGYYWLGSKTAVLPHHGDAKKIKTHQSLFWESLPAIVILLVLSLMEFARLAGALGGFIGILERSRHASSVAINSGFIVSTRFTYIFPAVIVWWHSTYVLMSKSSRRPTLVIWIVTILMLMQQIVLGNRTRAIVPIVAIAFVHLATHKLHFRKQIIVLLGVVVVLLIILTSVVTWRSYSNFSDMGRFSYEDATESILENATFQGLYKRIIRADEITNIALVAHIVYTVPEKVAFLYGETFTYWLQLFLPDLYSDKSPGGTKITAGLTVAEFLHSPNRGSGLPPNFIGELFMNFGVPGVLLGMYLLGLCLRLIYSLYTYKRHSPYVLFVFAFLTINFGALLLRNDISTVLFVNLYGFIAATFAALSAKIIYRLLLMRS